MLEEAEQESNHNKNTTAASPVRLSVVDSWTGSRSPGSPPVFLGNGSRPVAPAFPRTGPGEPSSPPSAVLCRRYDFPFTHPRSLICFACGVHADLLGSCLASSRSRRDGGCPPGRGVCSAGYPMPACSHVGAMGSRRFPGDPSCAFAPLQDPGRTTDPSPWRYRRCCPRTTQSEGFQREHNFEATAGLWHLLPTLHEWCCHRPCKARFRLAGWPLPGGS